MLKIYEYDKYLYLSNSEIKEEIKTKKYFSGLLNKGSYHIHPLKYLYGLVKELIKLNVEIYENTPVNKIVNSKQF